MDQIILQILNGLDKGSAYALIALGLTLIFGTLGVVNFAHGALFMLGAFCAVTLSQILSLSHTIIDESKKDFLGNPLKVEVPYVHGWFGEATGQAIIDWSVPLAILFTIPVMIAIGVIMERGLIKHFYKRPHADQILVTFGLAIVLQGGVSGRPASVGGDMVAPLQNFGISLMSMGLLVPDDTAMIWRGPMVQSALTQMLNSVAWGNLDVIVIDLPPGTGDIQISLAQQVNLAGAIIVSTPQDIALLDVVKALTMFQKANVPVLGMIENMSYWSCPDCGRVDHIFGEGGVKIEAKKRNIDLLGEIPISAEVRKGSDSGIPIIISDPESIQSINYRTMAKTIIKSIKLDEEELK